MKLKNLVVVFIQVHAFEHGRGLLTSSPIIAENQFEYSHFIVLTTYQESLKKYYLYLILFPQQSCLTLIQGGQIIICSIAYMKKILLNKVNPFLSINQTVSHSLEKVKAINLSDSTGGVLSKNAIKSIQSQLVALQGFTIASRTINYLINYCEYHSLLRSIICSKSQTRSPNTTFLNEYSKIHSSQNMSKMFNQIIVKDRQIIKRNKMYSQQCLFDYFCLNDFVEQKIQNTLVRRIIDGKRKGLIVMQQKKKRQKAYYRFNIKENNSNVVLNHKRKDNSIFEETELYYSIITLKLLLREPLPNMPQVNKTCEQIKHNLEQYLSNLKIKNNAIIKSHRSSIFKRQ